MNRSFLLLSLGLLALPALAQSPEPQEPPADADAAAEETAQLAAARKRLAEYLNAVEKKNWAQARKLTHPRTLEVIADVKKRLGTESHSMAPWAQVKERYLQNAEIVDVRESANGAVVARTSEDIYFVADKGVEEGATAEYLLIELDGQWYVTDRRVGEDQFPDKTVPLSYKGYFQGEYQPPAKKGSRK